MDNLAVLVVVLVTSDTKGLFYSILIQMFTVKARLQAFPTKLNLSIWSPHSHSLICKHHAMSHILNDCHFYKGLHVFRHDRIVDIISESLPSLFSPTVSIHKLCWQQMFSRCFAEMSVFSNLSSTRPDITIIDENN